MKSNANGIIILSTVTITYFVLKKLSALETSHGESLRGYKFFNSFEKRRLLIREADSNNIAQG